MEELIQHIEMAPKRPLFDGAYSSTAGLVYASIKRAIIEGGDTIKLDHDGFSTYKKQTLVYKQDPIEGLTPEKRAMFFGPKRKWLLLIIEKDKVVGQHLKLVSDTDDEVICKLTLEGN